MGKENIKLIKCPDCGKMISRRASHCLHCFAPINEEPKAESKEENIKLIKCPDCGKMISRRASHCVNCGAPVNEQPKAESKEAGGDSKKAAVSKEDTKKGCLGCLGVIIVISILYSLCSGPSDYSTSKRKSTSISSESCYSLGYRYGVCAAKSHKGLPCSPENDIIIPARCREKSETQRGINDGTRSVLE